MFRTMLRSLTVLVALAFILPPGFAQEDEDDVLKALEEAEEAIRRQRERQSEPPAPVEPTPTPTPTPTPRPTPVEPQPTEGPTADTLRAELEATGRGTPVQPPAAPGSHLAHRPHSHVPPHAHPPRPVYKVIPFVEVEPEPAVAALAQPVTPMVNTPQPRLPDSQPPVVFASYAATVALADPRKIQMIQDRVALEEVTASRQRGPEDATYEDRWADVILAVKASLGPR